MPLNIPDQLPAYHVLTSENIFVMKETEAIRQDIRPLKLVILNLMPLKISTETHLLRALSNTPLQVEIDLLRVEGHESKNTPAEHLNSFYKTFPEIKNQRYDGMIITGAPLAHIPFEEVSYWDEMKQITDWSYQNVTSTLFICWAAQAALYHQFKTPRHSLKEKMFGLFWHEVHNRKSSITRGFDEEFLAPHSRHKEVRTEDIQKIPELEIISSSKEAGPYIIGRKDGRQWFVTGHSEYDPFCLKEEYERDIQQGKKISLPKNYFPNNDPKKKPIDRWRSHANLLFSNWLNYYVYQVTSY